MLRFISILIILFILKSNNIAAGDENIKQYESISLEIVLTPQLLIVDKEDPMYFSLIVKNIGKNAISLSFPADENEGPPGELISAWKIFPTTGKENVFLGGREHRMVPRSNQPERFIIRGNQHIKTKKVLHIEPDETKIVPLGDFRPLFSRDAFNHGDTIGICYRNYFLIFNSDEVFERPEQQHRWWTEDKYRELGQYDAEKPLYGYVKIVCPINSTGILPRNQVDINVYYENKPPMKDQMIKNYYLLIDNMSRVVRNPAGQKSQPEAGILEKPEVVPPPSDGQRDGGE